MRRRTLLAASGGISFGAMMRSPIVTRAGTRALPWRELWNGKNLDGWQTWMGRPSPTVPDLPLERAADGAYVGPLGLGTDPRGVYSVVRVKGERLLRVSGEIFGAITSTREFSDFHLIVQWRWGQARWAPRLTEKRDSGVLYHCTGEYGSSGPSYNWMRSLECQIQEQDCGDLWALGGAIADSSAKLSTDDKGNPAWLWDPQGREVRVPGLPPQPNTPWPAEPRVRRGANHEHALGEWNTVEVLVQGDEAEHRVNGKTVLRLKRARVREGTGIAGKDQSRAMPGLQTPLTQGKLQIQSEGAEIFFRRIALQGLPAKKA